MASSSSSNGRSLQRLIAGMVAASRTRIRRATTSSNSTSNNLGRCYHCSSYTTYSYYQGSSSLLAAYASSVPKSLTGFRFQHSSSSSSNDTLDNNKNNDTGGSGNGTRLETEDQTERMRTGGRPPPSDDNDDNDDDDKEEWVPPERPLAGDKGQSHVYAHVEEQGELKQLEIELKQLEEPTKPTAATGAAATTTDQDSPSELDGLVPDWLKTRRQRLQGTELMKPQDSAAAKQKLLSEIPVVKHALLKRTEIITVIEALGGQDIACILDDLTRPRMAGALGMIITTGSNHALLRAMAEALLRQLRLRNLEACGVIGALEGIEGNVGDPYEDWLVLDCENYVVHFQTPLSRKALNIEGLWSGLDGTHQLDLSNESQVDDFIAANPVPEWYNAGASPLSDWDKKVKVLKKSRFGKSSKTSRDTGGFRKRPRSARWR